MKGKSYILSLSLALIPIVSFSQSGSLDPSFGTAGQVHTAIDNYNDRLYDIALQSDGKMVAVGYTNNGTDLDFAVVRYLEDGALDASFGNAGMVTLDLGVEEIARAVAIQPDGKIVMAGGTVFDDYNQGYEDIVIVRYNADGSLDNSFGTSGIVMTSTGIYNSETLVTVLIQPDGKIVAAGNYYNGNDNLMIIRYNTDGSLDNSFGTGGIKGENFGYSQLTTSDAALQADGKILLSGTVNVNGKYDWLVARFRSTGDIDSTFGTGGIAITNLTPYDDLAGGMIIQGDGQIVVGGSAHSTSLNNDLAMVRYTSNGIPDNSFGSNGQVISEFGAWSEFSSDLLYLSNGKLLLTGHSDAGFPEGFFFALAQYNTDGSIDSSFGNDGLVTTPGTGSIFSALLQPDGKIVAGGYTEIYTNDEFALARYLDDFSTTVAEAPELNILNFSVSPNPLSAKGSIQYTLSETTQTTMELFDINGRKINTIVPKNSNAVAGVYELNFSAAGLPEGLYLLQIHANDLTKIVRIAIQ